LHKLTDRKGQILLLSWLGVIIWMGIIYWSSSRPSELSSADSGHITEAIISLLDRVGITGSLNSKDASLTLLVRKLGHFFGYLILTLLLINVLIRTSYAKTGKYAAYSKLAIAAVIIAVIFAISDEIHQSFVPGRSMRISDVGIDASAAFAASLLYMRLFIRRR
jgi:VanZ family protein